MKKLVIIIFILLAILAGMILYLKLETGSKNNINVQEIENIEDYISKIYMWKEITNEALPCFDNINEADDLWIWEVIKKNLDNYELTYEEIQEKSKEIFGENFKKEFPKEGNESLKYDESKYIATQTQFDEEEDVFLLNNIIKTQEGYKVEIIEYLEDYSENNNVIIRNLQNEEIGKVKEDETETKIQEIVKNNINRFNKKIVYLNILNEKLYIQKVEKE